MIDLLSWLCIIAGSVFCVIGGIGLLRLPDFYARVHAGGLTDTLGTTLIMLGLVLQAGPTLIAGKLGVIVFVIYVTSPTGAHALVKAAFSRGIRVPEPGDSDAARS